MPSFYTFLVLLSSMLPAYGQYEIAYVRPAQPLAPPQSSSVALTADESLALPLLQVKSLLLVEASLGTAEGYYLFDTGAPGLLLNETYVEHAGGRSLPDAVVDGATGAANVGRVLLPDFRLGGLRQRGVRAYVLTLDYLSEALGYEILGIVGRQQFDNVVVHLDARRSRLTFLEAFGERDAAHEIRFGFEGHIPRLYARLDGLPVDLGFDTAAGIGVLDEATYARLRERSRAPESAIAIRGFGAVVDSTRRQRVRLVEVADGNWHDIAFAAVPRERFLDHGLRLNGLLGADWLARKEIVLDYRAGRLYIL